MGDGKAKELIRMTHGHELRWGNNGEYRVERNKWEKKKWDNCNNIVNKIYLKNKMTEH